MIHRVMQFPDTIKNLLDDYCDDNDNCNDIDDDGDEDDANDTYP